MKDIDGDPNIAPSRVLFELASEGDNNEYDLVNDEGVFEAPVKGGR